MKNTITLCLVSILLAACAATSDDAISACERQGYQHRTHEFAQCFMRESQAREQANRETWEAVGQTWDSIPKAPRTVHTTCNTMGSVTNCSSY